MKQLRGQRIALKLEKEGDLKKLSSGIFIAPPAEGNTPTTAIVAHIGHKVTDFEVGDRVYIGKHYGEEQEIEGNKYVLLREDDIIAKL